MIGLKNFRVCQWFYVVFWLKNGACSWGTCNRSKLCLRNPKGEFSCLYLVSVYRGGETRGKRKAEAEERPHYMVCIVCIRRARLTGETEQNIDGSKNNFAFTNFKDTQQIKNNDLSSNYYVNETQSYYIWFSGQVYKSALKNQYFI